MTTVVHFSSDETGAPTLNNAAGSMIAVLDACLVNGFNAKSVASIVVASGVATATISAHGLETGRLYEFAGSTVTGGDANALNGRKKITVTGPNEVTFPAPGVADQAATGTITGKRPSLGWTKAFTGTNKAIYQRTDPQATAMLLRVDDTGTGVASATNARALMVESATGIDTYTNHAPTTAQLSGGQYWSKGVSNTNAKEWILVGDSKTFYLWTEESTYPFSTQGALHMRMFGDISSYRAGDAYGCAIGGDTGTSGQSTLPSVVSAGSAPSNSAFVLSRTADTLVLSAFASLVGPYGGSVIGSAGPTFPSPIDNGVALTPTVFISEANTAFSHPIRGHMRGLLAPVAAVGNRMHKRVLTNLEGTDRDVIFIATVTNGAPGCAAVDLTGPWG